MADNDRLGLIRSNVADATASTVAAARPSEHHAAPATRSGRRASLVLSGEDAAQGLEAHNPLKRTLTAVDLTGIGVAGIVGAGIYVLTGAAAAQYAGPSVILAFVLSAIGCAFACLCYSELASVLPVAGSAYSFASATLGQFVGFVIGWDLCLEYVSFAAGSL